MLIKEFNKINEDIAKAIKELVAECNAYDGLQGMLELDTSFNYNKDMNTIFLLYVENKLVSALTLFVPTQAEAEISAMTLPEFRKKGYFSELVKRAEEEIKKYGIPEILFVCEAESNHGKTAIAKHKAKYDFAEYLLKYNHSFDKQILEYDFNLELHKAEKEDLETIIKISMDAFGDSYEGAKILAQNRLDSESRQLFLGKAKDQFVGMGTETSEGDSTSINGLAVLSEHQGKGYGKEMLYLIIKKLIEQKTENILIEVDSQNERAFKLYRNTGFDIQTAWEYYRKLVSMVPGTTDINRKLVSMVPGTTDIKI